MIPCPNAHTVAARYKRAESVAKDVSPLGFRYLRDSYRLPVQIFIDFRDQGVLS